MVRISLVGFWHTSKFTAFVVCCGVPKQNAKLHANARINSSHNASTLRKNLMNISSVSSEFKKGD